MSYLGHVKHIIVEELAEDEKHKLFNAILGHNNRFGHAEIRRFLKLLPSFPLDVSTAAYYVKNVDITLEEYAKLLETMGESFLNLSGNFMFKYNDYNKTRYGIVVSTLKAVIGQNENFKKILLFICLMDSQKIPLDVLKITYNSDMVSELLHYLKKYLIITTEEDTISIHRKIQYMGLRYVSEIVGNGCANAIEQILSALTPYEHINVCYPDLRRFIPHLKALLAHLDELNLSEDKKVRFRIKLLLTIGNIYRYKEQSIEESVSCFEDALKLNDKWRYLDKNETAKVRLTAGEACVLLNQNDLAERYLQKSLADLSMDKELLTDFSNNLRLLGILCVRRDDFEEANRYFDEAIKLLEGSNHNDIASKLVMARIYAAKSLNYLNRYINKSGMSDAISLMKKAIGILEMRNGEERSSSSSDAIAVIRELADLKINLGGLENSVMHHDIALKLAEETEQLLRKLPGKDNSSFCSLGKVYTEKGHAYLRMNELKKAKEMFSKARRICDKAQVNDYVWRTRMQQAEVLIRLGEFDKAYENCIYMFNLQNRERNIGGDLFYNTSYYNAAVIQYHWGNMAKSLEHFRDFFVLMKEFCEAFLEKDDYKKLMKEEAFECIRKESDIKRCFGNALKIFTAVCMKGSGFITDYVEQNYRNLCE